MQRDSLFQQHLCILLSREYFEYIILCYIKHVMYVSEINTNDISIILNMLLSEVES